MTVSKDSIDFIVSEEIGSIAEYNSSPNWPGGQSGVTIGIGYDLGMNKSQQITSDWLQFLNGNYVVTLAGLAGYSGPLAKSKINQLVKLVKIPYEVAYDCFIKKTLPRFCNEALLAFPGINLLNADTQGMLVSLVFNRGSRMKDINAKSQDRLEMRELVDAVSKQDYVKIADEIESMKRLWDGIPEYSGEVETKLTGLVNRRIKESNIVRASVTKEDFGELFNF